MSGPKRPYVEIQKAMRGQPARVLVDGVALSGSLSGNQPSAYLDHVQVLSPYADDQVQDQDAGIPTDQAEVLKQLKEK